MSENFISAHCLFYCNFFLECVPTHACTQTHTHTQADQVSVDVVSAHGDSGPAKCHSILTGVALRGCQMRHNELAARRFPPAVSLSVPIGQLMTFSLVHFP